MFKSKDLTEIKRKEFNIDQSVSLSNTWFEISDETKTIDIGKHTKFINATITVKAGGKLTIGNLCEIRGRIIIEENCTLEIGHGLICNGEIKIHSAENAKIIIGNDCLFANPQILNSDLHSIFSIESGMRINNAKDVVIKDRVWLATNSIVLKGTILENDTVVGAGSVVSGKFSSNSVIAGNPGRIVKENTSWSRTLLERRTIKFDNDFSVSSFRIAATAFDHTAVIEMAGKYLVLWNNMDASNYFIFYYLARSILIRHFTHNNIKHLKIADAEVTVITLSNLLIKAYELSNKKNYMCGGYAYLTCKMACKGEKATEIFNEILPHWDNIKDIRFQEKWTLNS
ncbi:acyltransferase [Rouxiella sp. T17]|uniref:acyltransferase n=1 Tax=Rouxiella sp. T17 TaxID=3085684 RepID=UPI002FC98C30